MGCLFSKNIQVEPQKEENEINSVSITPHNEKVNGKGKKSNKSPSIKNFMFKGNSNSWFAVSYNRSRENNIIHDKDSENSKSSYHILPDNYMTNIIKSVMIRGRSVRKINEDNSVKPFNKDSNSPIAVDRKPSFFQKRCEYCNISFDSKDSFNDHVRVSFGNFLIFVLLISFLLVFKNSSYRIVRISKRRT